jgi:RHH-type transcriptional regulator, rel operon repressor / antitoxin RelB
MYYRGDKIMPVISIRLPDEVSRRLNALAKKTKRTKTSFIREMVEDKLTDYEEAYTALERLNDKNARYLTTEELEKKLGL